MNITIFGTGYVGLVTGACLSDIGHNVMCIDIDENKIENLKKGIIPIYEPGLEEIVKRNYKNSRLNFSSSANEGIQFGKVIFSAVGTPEDENHRADLRFVKAVSKTVGELSCEDKFFINKSTIPVGTGAECKKIIQKELNKRGENINIHIISNPEFLREGSAVQDFLYPDRIVCGVEDKTSEDVMREVYKPLVRGNTKLFFTDIKSSEIIKYAANAFLATKLSFINEIANFAEKSGGNIDDISYGIGLDERIGSKFLKAGIGYGGSCFPKDVAALQETGKDFGYEFQIIKATQEVNNRQKTIVIDKLMQFLPDLKDKKIAIWGLTYKPNTDDTREAPSLSVIEKLADSGIKKITAYDPICDDIIRNKFENLDELEVLDEKYSCLKDADGLILLTEWDEFKNTDFEKVGQLMKNKIIIDGRNVWSKELKNNGFKYSCIGKN
ncbi:MAG: UDP-glucose/GDP-mannose dehydrogenase family protein [Candidatus Gracilibacteria bacterium]|nr:UDP-glucose/GDP-mannose dehydrogenase family protein [Candidatus Gracilibacteria bacterium]